MSFGSRIEDFDLGRPRSACTDAVARTFHPPQTQPGFTKTPSPPTLNPKPKPQPPPQKKKKKKNVNAVIPKSSSRSPSPFGAWVTRRAKRYQALSSFSGFKLWECRMTGLSRFLLLQRLQLTIRLQITSEKLRWRQWQ